MTSSQVARRRARRVFALVTSRRRRWVGGPVADVTAQIGRTLDLAASTHITNFGSG